MAPVSAERATESQPSGTTEAEKWRAVLSR